jgi:hypothetical protein
LAEASLVYIFGVSLAGKAGRAQKYRLWVGALLATLVAAAYLYAARDDLPRFWALAGPRPRASLREDLIAILALSHFLVPVMSAVVVLTLASAWRIARGLFERAPRVDVTPETILYAAGAALCIRSLFGSVWTEIPAVSVPSYPILFVIAGVLLAKAFALPSGGTAGLRHIIAKAIPSAAFLTYGIARLGLFLATGVHYYPLETAAGRVLLEEPASVAVYNYVIAQTGPEDLVVDIAFDGGGVNFSARRRAPLFMTMFAFFTPSEERRSRDADRIRTAKPALVIGNTDDHLGTMYGGPTVNGCPFPHLAWRSGRMTGDPAKVLPVLAAVKENYTPVFHTGDIEVLKRNDLLAITEVRPSGGLGSTAWKSIEHLRARRSSIPRRPARPESPH